MAVTAPCENAVPAVQQPIHNSANGAVMTAGTEDAVAAQPIDNASGSSESHPPNMAELAAQAAQRRITDDDGPVITRSTARKKQA